jgi:hypothetical protein
MPKLMPNRRPTLLEKNALKITEQSRFLAGRRRRAAPVGAAAAAARRYEATRVQMLADHCCAHARSSGGITGQIA